MVMEAAKASHKSAWYWSGSETKIVGNLKEAPKRHPQLELRTLYNTVGQRVWLGHC